MSAIAPHERKRLEDILKDAAGKSGRHLTVWEASFLSDIQRGMKLRGADFSLSDRQWGIIGKIEDKLYKVG